LKSLNDIKIKGDNIDVLKYPKSQYIQKPVWFLAFQGINFWL